MRKNTLAISPAAPRRTYAAPAMTVLTLSPRVLQTASPPPVVPVDTEDPGDEALSPEADFFGPDDITLRE